MELEKNKGKFIFLVTIVVIMLGIGILGYLYLLNQRNEISEIKKNLEKERIVNQNISELKGRIGDLENKDAQLGQIFLDSNNVVGFIETIERLAVGRGVVLNIQDVKGVDEGDREIGSILSMVLKAEGSWNGVNNFLEDIENLNHHIDIRNVKLVKSGGVEATSSAWTIDMGLNILTK